MIIKKYRYQIKTGSELRYLDIQESAQKIYRRYGDIKFSIESDNTNPLIKKEVIQFLDANADEQIQKIDQDPDVLKLFETFKQDCLDLSAGDVQEETLQIQKTFLGLPMQWDLKNWHKDLWNSESDEFFPPKRFGIGHGLNFHKLALVVGLIKGKKRGVGFR